MESLAKLIRELVKESPHGKQLGFFELYHDYSIAKIRQNENLYSAFKTIWKRPDLWVVFDRVIYMDQTDMEKDLPLHVDQNPHQHPYFSNLQGLLAIEDVDESTGMPALIPGSHEWFKEYEQWSDHKQGWIQYKGNDYSKQLGELTAIRLKAGQILIWDSRTTHSRVLPMVQKDKVKQRMLAMVTFMPAKKDSVLINKRIKAYEHGGGFYDHDAGLRKTANSKVESLRVKEERLSELGKKLYGIEPW